MVLLFSNNHGCSYSMFKMSCSFIYIMSLPWKFAQASWTFCVWKSNPYLSSLFPLLISAGRSLSPNKYQSVEWKQGLNFYIFFSLESTIPLAWRPGVVRRGEFLLKTIFHFLLKVCFVKLVSYNRLMDTGQAPRCRAYSCPFKYKTDADDGIDHWVRHKRKRTIRRYNSPHQWPEISQYDWS